MAEAFQSKVDSGEARKASSGFSGKGFTFDDSEQSESQQVKHGSRCTIRWRMFVRSCFFVTAEGYEIPHPAGGTPVIFVRCFMYAEYIYICLLSFGFFLFWPSFVVAP